MNKRQAIFVVSIISIIFSVLGGLIWYWWQSATSEQKTTTLHALFMIGSLSLVFLCMIGLICLMLVLFGIYYKLGEGGEKN